MDETRFKPLSTIVGTCPSCKAYVRLPMEAKSDATVRCPHCSETFSVAAVLAQIPELELVENTPPEKIVPLVDRQPVVPPPIVERKKFEVPHQLISGAKKRRKRKSEAATNLGDSRPVSRRSSPISFAPANESVGLVEVSEPSTDSDVDSLEVLINPDSIARSSSNRGVRTRGPRPMDPANAARVRVHSSQRHRRLKASSPDPSFEIAKIILGGLLAFPIAYLILLWGVGQDPLRLAPTLSKSIPFVVPQKMRVDPKSADRQKQKRSTKADSEPNLQPSASVNERLQPRTSKDLTGPADGSTASQALSVPDVAPDVAPDKD